MKLCLVCVEIFAFGKYGGFGRATRAIGSLLAKKDVEVTAIVPRRAGQQAVEIVDGIKIYSYPPSRFWQAGSLARQVNADIYHSQEPSLATYLIQKACPDKKHIITFRDTREAYDWFLELKNPSLNYLQVISNWLFEDSCLVHRAVKNASAVYCASRCIGERAKRHYHLDTLPRHLPTPVSLFPDPLKAAKPTVCFVGRLDRRKRPELFFNCVASFPWVHFYVCGKSRDKQYGKKLRREYGELPNLTWSGFVDQFETDKLSRIFERSWVYVNTASREGLPNAYIEAAAHQCAILSNVNPDNFASSFGYHAGNKDFNKGLEYLLNQHRWKDLGKKGYSYVAGKYEQLQALNHHLSVYGEMLGS